MLVSDKLGPSLKMLATLHFVLYITNTHATFLYFNNNIWHLHSLSIDESHVICISINIA